MEQHRSALGLSPEQVNTLLTAAGQAPSLHNSQPWQFRLRPRSIELPPSGMADTNPPRHTAAPAGQQHPPTAGRAAHRGYPVPATPRRDLADLVIPDSAEIRS
jgi:hypothetical protein